MRHQIAFKQFNPLKPAKYGMLHKSINDARFPYTYKINVYASKPAAGSGPYYIVDGVQGYVKDLINRFNSERKNGGRNVTMDRLYRSVETAQWLLDEHDMTTTMTMISTRKGMPDEIKDARSRPELGKTIHYLEPEMNITLCTYTVKTKSKGKKNVPILTTRRPLLGQTMDDEKKKPAIYKHYDFTKGGTDIMDQKIGKYSTKCTTQRWPLVSFFFVLDTARVNATTLHALAMNEDPRKADSYKQGWELAKSFILPWVMMRPRTGLQTPILEKINRVLPSPERPLPLSPSHARPLAQSGALIPIALPSQGTQRKCSKCKLDARGAGYRAGKDNLYGIKQQCQICGDAVCRKHLISLCHKHIAK